MQKRFAWGTPAGGNNMKRIAVIMAGGGGTRFWPMSRLARPKQLISLTSDKVMINETIDHYSNIVKREDTFIVTNCEQTALMSNLLYPEVERSHILSEPVGKNTAPCILYAALVLKKLYGDALMAVLPADHHISDLKEYERILKLAYDTAETTDEMVTIGLWPTHPATGYGYIRFSEKPVGGNGSEVYRLQRFVEKPELLRAQEYVRSGRYLWNSGMFIWKASVIIAAFQRDLPELYEKMNAVYDKIRTPEEQKAIDEVYPQLQSVSIDYGIMEKATAVNVIPAEFGWNDVGSWDALTEVFPTDDDGNVIRADHLSIDTENCVISSTSAGRLIATIGVSDLIIVDTGDALMICHRDRAQDVKKLVEELKRQGRTDLV